VTKASALAEDCALADVVISRVPMRAGRCPGPVLVIDRFALWREGAHALWLAGKGIRVERVREARGARPWHPIR
jgi:competence protein ComEC